MLSALLLSFQQAVQFSCRDHQEKRQSACRIRTETSENGSSIVEYLVVIMANSARSGDFMLHPVLVTQFVACEYSNIEYNSFKDDP